MAFYVYRFAERQDESEDPRGAFVARGKDQRLGCIGIVINLL